MTVCYKMADISYLQNEDVEDTDEQMAFSQPNDDWSDIQDWSHPMAKLQRYAGIQAQQNSQLVGRILIEVFRNAVDNGTELNVVEVMESVHKLINESDENVRLELIEQLPHVAMICQEVPERFGDVLSNHLIHLVCACLVDEDQQVRQATHTALMTFVERGLLDKGSIEFPVAPTLLMMGEQPGKLDLVTLAIDGMSKVASLLEPATAEKLFLRRYLSLCRDGNFFIRKLCALHFGEFSVALPKDTVYNKLLPMYVTLCKDAFWIVRKSCAEVIVSVACTVSLEHRSTILSEILANFLSDESKWVRISAYQHLGPFISTFAQQYTGFSYNQFGELVMTDHHGAELRYNMISFTGSPDSSMAASKVATDEDYDNINNSSSNNNIMLNSSNHSNVQWCSVGSLETSNYYDNTRSSTPNNNHNNDDNSLTEEHHLFNPFLYYYIPPDLQLDDELVRAATSSVLTANNQQKPTIIIVDQNHQIINNVYNETSDNEDNTTTTKNDDDEKIEKEINIEEKTEKDDNDDIEIKLDNDNDDDEDNNSSLNKLEKSENNTIDYSTIFNDSNENKSTSDNESNTSLKSLNDTINLLTISDDNNQQEQQQINNNNNSNNTIKNDNDIKGQTIVPQILVDYFVSMADPEAWWNTNPSQIPRFCAFYFPAVVLTLGKDNWNMLKTAYGYLSDAREYKVRRIMASSIHEVAMILGEELSSQDLLPIYDGFIKDLDEVRIGALKHLSTFLKVLNPTDRCFFLPRLKAFLAMDNEWNWRFREEAAHKFLEAIPLFKPRDVYTFIMPLSFPLLNDKVSAVRHMARALVTQIVSYLATDEELITAHILELRTILTASTSKWTSRQSYALLCESLISCEAISAERFSKEFLPCLLALCSDPVPNVRLAAVRTLTTQVSHISNALGTKENEEIQKIFRIMRQDPDRDVRILAGGDAGTYSGDDRRKLIYTLSSN
ncbi:serine/threonine-protein phosphatase 4 regulatory subunit 1-like isoform X2 [Aphidius gifuensis]|uniref:serine/threonine-protein phosphatase 4 regulatory subunit 1-like isoform X2 n=1 Tax=Aphidius gifuensis TaxID=684658 RepID=UPI001CDD55DD|nr:serine/threonine-protein phosphatase 4 regulatory subunit 1-like isoform X2 [Aphidius gifuensis]